MTRRTKIVCTLGPASSSPERIAALVAAGMDVARINFSHGTLAGHAEVIARVRRAAGEAGRPVAVLGDLQGPKIRVGELAEPLELHAGSVVTFAPEGEHAPGEVPSGYPRLADDVTPGDVVLLADGLLELEVEEVRPPRVRMRVVNGGTLTSRKGISLPGGARGLPPLTDKDLEDLRFALEQGLDYVALSFVRAVEDVADLVRRIPPGGPQVVVKVEKEVALEALEPILEAASAAMVARGDLGVELPFERVPLAQKRMIQLANYAVRPVITATQMLESMVDNPRPTRAEASDVANAILDGTDAVMLSAETAVGRFPVQAVQAMARIAEEIDRSDVLDHGPRYDFPAEPRAGAPGSTERAIAAATAQVARRIGAPVIVTVTRSGLTARQIASQRPPVPILALTTSRRTYNQLALVWGVVPVLAEERPTRGEMLRAGCDAALERGLARPGDRIVLTAGTRVNEAGGTDLLMVETL
ncbi:MAG TPA: pyruvate kinase [Longimicrobiaceae bacterium]|nr:pyruvate kinase [Longimicrobiaceae bacterium]